jgi:hypothetical protein
VVLAAHGAHFAGLDLRRGSIGWSDGANRSQSSVNCPCLAISMTASAAPAEDALIGPCRLPKYRSQT